jgi:hypothetical protein
MTARGRRLRTAVATVLLAVAAAGCGGESSAEDPRAELRRWRSAVDDVCRATRERIAERGDARDALELESVAAQAGDDVRAAIERIRGVPISAEGRRRVRPFLAELAKVEPQLTEMTRTTADGRLNQIGRIGIRLADTTKRLQDRAEAVGLRECADKRQFDAVLDAFTAPVYATKIARFELWLAGALRPFASSPPPMTPAFAGYVERLGRVFDRAEKRLSDLYTFLPNRAVKADNDLGYALRDYESYLETVADSLRGGSRVLTPVGVKEFQREVDRHKRKVKRAFGKLETAIGAQPLVVPDAEPQQDSGLA